MRKFYVTYSEYSWNGDDFSYTIITLNEGEKANLSTFENKLRNTIHKQIISWSLIEE